MISLQLLSRVILSNNNDHDILWYHYKCWAEWYWVTTMIIIIIIIITSFAPISSKIKSFLSHDISYHYNHSAEWYWVKTMRHWMVWLALSNLIKKYISPTCFWFAYDILDTKQYNWIAKVALYTYNLANQFEATW